MGLAVAGFHRSGTSSVMQHLVQSGLDPGEDLIGGDQYNRDGYFEDWGPIRIHDDCLAAVGLDWAIATTEAIPMGEKHKARIRDYCLKRAAKSTNWGFKDPRACQFLDYWMDIDPALKIVIVYRSPAECSWSIYRRAITEFARGYNAEINSRIKSQPDHALKLWISHNLKLLHLFRSHPDRTVIVSHAGFAAGFNIAAALREHFGFGLNPTDVTETFREDLVTRTVNAFPVSSLTLRDEALSIWNQMQDADLAKSKRGKDSKLQLVHDPSGLRLSNQLLSMEVAEAHRIADAAAEDSKTIHLRLESAQYKLAAARKVATKLRRWPFSIFFVRNKKYRKLVEEILS